MPMSLNCGEWLIFQLKERKIFHKFDVILAFHIMVKSALDTRIDTYIDYTTVRIFPLNGAHGTNLVLMETKPGD